MASLKSYLWPQSVVIVGASPETGGVRGRLTNVFTSHAFAGESYLVSRSVGEIEGRKTFASVSEIPGTIDLAVICVPARFVLDEVRRCAQKGVKAVQVASSGFAEEGAGEGRELQAALLQFAREHDIALIGPNAQGLVNTYNGLFATFASAYDDPSHTLLPRHRHQARVAIVSQSGGIGSACFYHARSRELPLSFAASTGNSAGVELFDLIEEFLEDEATAAILAFMEDVKRPGDFRRVADKALRKGVPIIVQKVGKSESGRRAAASHTGALASSYTGFQATFRKYGIIEAGDLGEMVDIANGFCSYRHILPRGRRVAILTGSGGGAGMMADAAELAGLAVPLLSPETQKRLREVILDFGSIDNPVDAGAQHFPKSGFSQLIARVQEDPGIDGMLMVGTLGNPRGYRFDVGALAQLAPRLEKPALMWSYTPAPQQAVEEMSSANIPVYEDARDAVRTMALMAEYRGFREQYLDRARISVSSRTDSAAAQEVLQLLAKAPANIPECDARLILSKYEICGEAGYLAQSADAAADAQAKIGSAVALKVQSADIPHKSEAGGVKLNLVGKADVRSAYREILSNAVAFRPDADVRGVLVQPMAPKGVEVIVGIATDETFGPLLMVGLGGILVEVLHDVAFAPVPLDRGEAHDLLRQLKGYAVLEGVRGAPAADVPALITLMVRLSQFAADFAVALAEVDLNPVLVHPRGGGLTVVDALIVKHLRPNPPS